MSTTHEPPVRRRLAARREFTAVVASGLTVSGAVAVGMSRPWFTATATPRRLPDVVAHATGGALAPFAGALALVPLAALGAVLASRGWLRRAVGAVLTACAAVIFLAAARPGGAEAVLKQGLTAKGWTAASSYTTSATPWRWIVLLAALGCAVVGALVVERGSRWPTMGQRYDALDERPPRPGAAEADPPGGELDEEALWRALDRGDDPTGEP